MATRKTKAKAADLPPQYDGLSVTVVENGYIAEANDNGFVREWVFEQFSDLVEFQFRHLKRPPGGLTH